MDEADRKRLAELNKQIEQHADTLLGKVVELPYSWMIIIVALVVAFLLGRWSV